MRLHRRWKVSTATANGAMAILVGGCGGTTTSPGSSATVKPTEAAAATVKPTEAAAATVKPTEAAAATQGDGLAPMPTLPVTATIPGFSGAVHLQAANDVVWVLDHSDSSVWPIDPTTNTVGTPIDLAKTGAANYLQPAAGLLWTSAFDSGDLVGFDPAKRKITRKVHVGDLDGGTLAVGDDRIWVIQGSSHDLVKVDPKKGTVIGSFTLPEACHDSLLAADGFLWAASIDGHLCKIDPSTGVVIAELDGAGAPWAMAWGAGRIWISAADGGVVLVDPTGPSIAATLPAPPAGTVDGARYSLGKPDESASIVADDDGAWVRYSHGTIGRVDLAPEPHWKVYTGLRGAFIGTEATGFGSTWIADWDQVLRIPAPKP